jgi:hypothetical protein
VAALLASGTAAAGSWWRTNEAPAIAGTPPTAATVAERDTVTPVASDPDGNKLKFSIRNKPAWASFSPSTGRLEGVPKAANVGVTPNIVIAVTDGHASVSLPAFSITVAAGARAPVESTPPANSPPTISGSAPTAVTAGMRYAFQPSAHDADGDLLAFAIANKPSWAAFDAATGALSGAPAAEDVGTTEGVQISVTDGMSRVALPSFSVTVQAVATGSAMLSWMPPTQNTDGSPFMTLSGYRVYWGTAAGSYPNSVTLSNPGLTSYVVSDLARGSYFFALKALSSTGAESDFSNVAAKTVQ